VGSPVAKNRDVSECRQQIIIEARPKIVWDLLRDVERHDEWWPGMVEVECEGLEAGSTYRQVNTNRFGLESERERPQGPAAPSAVGDPGLEPGTSSLSETRSNQLS
jgi:hypothetical protein